MRIKGISILMHDSEHNDKGDHHQNDRRGTDNYSITTSPDHGMRMSVPRVFSLLDTGSGKYERYARLKINKCRSGPRSRGVNEPSANDPKEGHKGS